MKLIKLDIQDFLSIRFRGQTTLKEEDCPLKQNIDICFVSNFYSNIQRKDIIEIDYFLKDTLEAVKFMLYVRYCEVVGHNQMFIGGSIARCEPGKEDILREHIMRLGAKVI